MERKRQFLREFTIMALEDDYGINGDAYMHLLDHITEVGDIELINFLSRYDDSDGERSWLDPSGHYDRYMHERIHVLGVQIVTPLASVVV